MKSSHEFWVTDDPEEAVRKAKITLKKVGTLTKVVPQEHIEGELSYSGSHVTLNITWREETAQAAADGRQANAPGAQQTATAVPIASTSLGTTLIVEAVHSDKSGSAQRSAIERFEDAYMHFDRADYTPDRLGFLPVTILSIVAAVVILVLVLLFLPKIKKSLGVADPVATPTPEAVTTP